MISTFIKSLLVNHTFLFVGYSINDYNFKQILDFIDYLSERIDADKSKLPMHYMISTDKEVSQHTKEYFSKKRIEILIANDCPPDYLTSANISSNLDKEEGKQLFAVLTAIIDKNSDIAFLGGLSQATQNRLNILDNMDMNYIPYESLMKIIRGLGFKNVAVENTACISDGDISELSLGVLELRFLENGKDYQQFKEICEQYLTLQVHFIKAGFYRAYWKGWGNKDFPNDDEIVFSADIKTSETDEFFDLYLDNNFTELFNKIESTDNIRLKAYYEYLYPINYEHLTDSKEDFSVLAKEIDKTAFWRLIDKVNLFLSCCTAFSMSSKNKDEAWEDIKEYFYAPYRHKLNSIFFPFSLSSILFLGRRFLNMKERKLKISYAPGTEYKEQIPRIVL